MFPDCLAGMVRFERTSHGVKVRCLNRLATPLCMKKAARQMWAAFLPGGVGGGIRTLGLQSHNLAL